MVVKINTYKGIWAEVKFKNHLTVVVLNDIHIPFQDPVAINLAKEIIKDVSPDLGILNGDIVDFAAISKFSRDPRKRILSQEIVKAKDFFHDWLNTFKFPWIYIEGNHENRLQQYIWSKASELTGLPELNLMNLLQIDVVHLAMTDEPATLNQFVAPSVIIGKLFITHGDRFKIGTNTINIARSLFLKVLKNFVIGHWHRSDRWIQMDYTGNENGVWVNPCLCYQRPYWDAAKLWSQGLTIIDFTPKGFFKVDTIPFIKENGEKIALLGGKKFAVKNKVL